MREILFRGKRVANDNWILGGFHSRDGKAYIIGISKQGRIDGVEVRPETVGQFTGLTDKNGKKIFEGDILSVTVNETTDEDEEIINDLIEIGIYTEADRQSSHKVPTGNKTKTVWTVEHKAHFNQGIGFYIYGKDRRFHLKLAESTLLNVGAEVIGNIHDNPELLGGDDK